MQLFEKELIDRLNRKYAGTRWTRPNVAFLVIDPRAERERQRIEEWFESIPSKSKPNIKGRLISENDTQHFSALNEMVVDRFLSENCLPREFEPEVEEGDPDFLVKASTPFYLEVASVFELEGFGKERKKTERLLEELNKIKHFFFLSITRASIPDSLNYRDIKRFVNEQMDALDVDTFAGIKEISYSRDGLELDLMISGKKSKTKGSIIGMHMLPFTWVNADHVTRAIKKKIQKYKSIKEMKTPFLVAVALEDERLDLEDVLGVLFGRESVEINRKTLEVVSVGRDNTGLFTPMPGKGNRIQNTRLSAVVFIRKKWSQDGVRLHNFIIIHNPFAEHPLPPDIFDKHAQFIVADQDDKSVSMRWTKSHDEYELL